VLTKPQRLVLSLLLGAFIVLVCSSGWLPVQAVSCDNEVCRDIPFYQQCGTGQCREFTWPACTICTPGLNSLCVVQGNFPPSCLQRTGSMSVNIIYHWETCNPLCSCTGGVAMVEADMLQTYLGMWSVTTTRQCQ
jgi:hypothetical protein